MTISSPALVSVVIPSYNHARYVAQAIESVLTQSYPCIELIVIDDGSLDESATVISALQERHNFLFVARENRGASVTLNEGIGLANGRYICFLASDDYYLPQRVENAIQVLENSAADVFASYCDGYVAKDGGVILGRFSDMYPRPSIGGTYKNLLVGNWIPAMGVTYKAEVLKGYMFDESQILEDYSLYLRMFYDDSGKLKSQNDFGFVYRWHASNISKDKQLMKKAFDLVQRSCGDLDRYLKFKRRVKQLRLLNRENASLKLFSILFLELIRKFRWRYWMSRRYLR